MEGHVGASGMHGCYICLIPKSEMQLAPGKRSKASFPKRTLKNLQEEYEKFMTNGGKRDQQSQFFNVVHEAIFQIEPNMWVIPILHITLGVVKKIHVLLLVVCHGLGIDIANHLARLSWPVGSSKYDEYISQKANLLKNEEKVLEVCDKIVDLKAQNEEDEDLPLRKVRENEATITELQVEMKKLEKEISQLEAKITLPGVDSDPVSACLDETLKKHGIKRQAYHGKSFVGNHCHKYLQKEVYESVTAGIVTQCELLCGDPDIIDEAKEIEHKFNETFRLYAEVYTAVAHSNFIPESDLSMIQEKIDKFLAYFRRTFPDSSIPVKFHLLEDHTVDWIRRFPFGLGLLGEQSAESVHAQVNRIKRMYVAVPSSTKRIHSTVQEQHLKCAPQLQALMPKSKRPKNK